MARSPDSPELLKLANGVRVALDPMPGLASCALGVYVRAGARDEPESRNGVAHLFEHMAFKGAGARDARAFAEAVEAVGGSVNAGTGYERTAYFGRFLAKDAAFALDLLADIVLEPHWSAEELEKEKGVVLQELGEANDAPDDRVFELHQCAVFPNQPLGRPILGAPETLAAIDVETLRAFKEAHTIGGGVVISVAGAFDRDRLLERVKARFAALPALKEPRFTPARPAAGVGLENRRLEQTHLVLSWPAPGARDAALPAARLLCEILGGGMASRLFQLVRERHGLAYAIDAFLDVYDDSGRLGVYAGCGPKDAKTVARMVGQALLEIAESGVSEEELARAKAVVSAQLLMGAEAPAARAEARANQVFTEGRLTPIAELARRIDRVRPDQILACARLAAAGPVAAAAIGPKAGLAAATAFMERSA